MELYIEKASWLRSGRHYQRSGGDESRDQRMTVAGERRTFRLEQRREEETMRGQFDGASFAVRPQNSDAQTALHQSRNVVGIQAVAAVIGFANFVGSVDFMEAGSLNRPQSFAGLDQRARQIGYYRLRGRGIALLCVRRRRFSTRCERTREPHAGIRRRCPGTVDFSPAQNESPAARLPSSDMDSRVHTRIRHTSRDPHPAPTQCPAIPVEHQRHRRPRPALSESPDALRRPG